MSTAATALNELPAKKTHNSSINNMSSSSESENATTDLSKLGPKATVTVNKVDSVKPSEEKEFMEESESEFGLSAADNKSMPGPTGTSPVINVPSSANNTTTITVSTSANNSSGKSATGNAKSSVNNMASGLPNNTTTSKLTSKLSDIKDSDIPDEPAVNELSTDTDSKTIDMDIEEKNETADSKEEDEEQSAAELVAAAAAQIANKTLKKTTGAAGSKTVKTTGKLLASGKQEQIMKKAMLMMNESGRLNVITDEPGPSIVKLNTPANKAQIKLRAFRQNFERQLAEMRRRTPLQIQTLRAELANIEFAEIGNKNIMAGLLELVDDHELKLLTIEKMLKSGDITLSF